MTTIIPSEELVERGVYFVRSRNLVAAVWDGHIKPTGFIGIREKFGNRYLFKEFHWDDGPPYGTVKPIELIATVPEEIELVEHFFRDGKHGEGYYRNEDLYNFLVPLNKVANKKYDELYHNE